MFSFSLSRRACASPRRPAYAGVGASRLCEPGAQPSVAKEPPRSGANHLLPTASGILAPLSNNGVTRQNAHSRGKNDNVRLVPLSAGAHANSAVAQTPFPPRRKEAGFHRGSVWRCAQSGFDPSLPSSEWFNWRANVDKVAEAYFMSSSAQTPPFLMPAPRDIFGKCSYLAPRPESDE